MTQFSFRFATLVVFVVLSFLTSVDADDVLVPAHETDSNGVAWYGAHEIGVEGQGWTDTESPFDRLPARAKELVRPAVWGLSKHSAGLCVRFVTDATEIHARWTLTSASLAMNHMPATGVSGLDLYASTKTTSESGGKFRWLAVGKPTAKENAAKLVSGIPQGTREYLLYFPLYNGVESVEIGIPKSASVWKPKARLSGLKPIVFYGTSITQGGCASRPGMVHTGILGRWLDAPVINLGFSGNGRMEAEVATLMSEIDASVFVIDCLPNIAAGDVTSRTEPLVRILRAVHPTTPIVLVEDRSYADSFLLHSKRERNLTSRVALKAVFDRLKKAGDPNLYYIPGEDLIGDDGEGTVDSSHPTDLGFLRQSEAFSRVLRPILENQRPH
ncbi:MAG: SGNH/GDSL hydrolase family protein [Rhodopirellula sp.]|nr:SGNH/GDSL hydrolase family protein [Rhodopirellula sp.]